MMVNKPLPMKIHSMLLQTANGIQLAMWEENAASPQRCQNAEFCSWDTKKRTNSNARGTPSKTVKTLVYAVGVEHWLPFLVRRMLGSPESGSISVWLGSSALCSTEMTSAVHGRTHERTVFYRTCYLHILTPSMRTQKKKQQSGTAKPHLAKPSFGHHRKEEVTSQSCNDQETFGIYLVYPTWCFLQE